MIKVGYLLFSCLTPSNRWINQQLIIFLVQVIITELVNSPTIRVCRRIFNLSKNAILMRLFFKINLNVGELSFFLMEKRYAEDSKIPF